MSDNRNLPTVQSNALASYDADQIRVLKQQIATGCDNGELEHFAMVCKRMALDPFSRQIYAIKRQGKMNIMPSIDGMRLLAQRSGKYRGQTPAEWCGEDGIWRDVWLSPQPPSAARVGVLHSDFDAPLVAVARWSSYSQTSSPTWKNMPDVMLAK